MIGSTMPDGNVPHLDNKKPRPSSPMPRWAPRLTLIVSAVKVKQPQDINWADAEAEGVEYETAAPPSGMCPGFDRIA
jgi:hypothetical protein